MVQLLPRLGEILFDTRHAAGDREIVDEKYGPDGNVRGEKASEILHGVPPLMGILLRILCCS